MAKRLTLGEYLIAVEGLGLARNLWSGSDGHTEQRLQGLRETLRAMDVPTSTEATEIATYEVDVATGYAAWAESYDDAPNALIAVEEPILRSVLARFAPGTAVDACAGSGRVTVMLEALGHRVTSFDATTAMLDVARAKVPTATMHVRTLDAATAHALGTFDLVTCSLALTHFPSLDEPVAALAALAKPEGHVVVSDLHPVLSMLDGQAFYQDPSGATPFVRSYAHRFADYLKAFRNAGLDVQDCIEVVPGEGEGLMASMVGILRPEAARSAYLGVPVALIWVLAPGGFTSAPEMPKPA